MMPMTDRREGALSAADPALQEGLDTLMQALCVQQRSAVVLCPDQESMDRLVLQVSWRLRDLAGVRLERVQPHGTEALVARFNALVEALPLAAARREGVFAGELKVWVMHLGRHVEWAEVRLLLNLVQGFPGTGVRLLLIGSQETVSDRAAQAALSWGSRLHRWVLPGEGPASAAREAPKPLEVVSSVAVRPSPQVSRAHRVLQAEEMPARRKEQPWHWRHWRLPTWARRPVQVIGHRWPMRRPGPIGSRRLAWGVGGLLLSISGAAGAWWQARWASSSDLSAPLRRPVPEIVELIDDTRPASVKQDQRS